MKLNRVALMALWFVMVPTIVFAQEAAPELPAFLVPFADGYWWVVPAYALVSSVVAGLDASFFTETFKAKWPASVRAIWDFLALNVGKSRNQDSADRK